MAIRTSMYLAGHAELIDDITDMKEQLQSEVVWAVGTPLEYGIYQEFGTYFHPPNPYLRPALRKAERNVDKVTSNSDDLEKIMRTLAMMVRDTAKAEAPVRTGALRDSIHAERRK